MIHLMKIPEERMPVLIGDNGETKNRIESRTKTSIKISDDVEINGEPIDILVSKDIIKAIGRGFPPEIAMGLLEEDNILHVMNIGKNSSLKRIKSRLIGSNGKTRRNIEKLSNVSLSIYGKTISIIGVYENVEKAAIAINKLIEGAPHKNAYKLLERPS